MILLAYIFFKSLFFSYRLNDAFSNPWFSLASFLNKFLYRAWLFIHSRSGFGKGYISLTF